MEKLLFVPFLLSHPVSSLFKVPDLKRRFGNSREFMMDPGAGPSAGECPFHFMTRGHGCHPLPRRDADSSLASRGPCEIGGQHAGRNCSAGCCMCVQGKPTTSRLPACTCIGGSLSGIKVEGGQARRQGLLISCRVDNVIITRVAKRQSGSLSSSNHAVDAVYPRRIQGSTPEEIATTTPPL